MQANTSIGEVVISLEDGREFLLRPSFYALNKIGSPQEIEETIDACVDALSNTSKKPDWYFSVMRVLHCCLVGNASDAFDLFGYLDEDLTFIKGKVHITQCIILANNLLKWGVLGNPGKRAKKSSGGKKELFDPQQFVGSAIAHLGLSKNDAWDLTMTEFQRAIEAKYPDDPSKEPIDQDQLAELEKMAKEAHKKLPADRASNQYKRTLKGRR